MIKFLSSPETPQLYISSSETPHHPQDINPPLRVRLHWRGADVAVVSILVNDRYMPNVVHPLPEYASLLVPSSSSMGGPVRYLHRRNRITAQTPFIIISKSNKIENLL